MFSGSNEVSSTCIGEHDAYTMLNQGNYLKAMSSARNDVTVEYLVFKCLGENFCWGRLGNLLVVMQELFQGLKIIVAC